MPSVQIICGEDDDDAAKSKNNGWTPQSEEEKGIFLCKYFECFFFPANAYGWMAIPDKSEALYISHTQVLARTRISLFQIGKLKTVMVMVLLIL